MKRTLISILLILALLTLAACGGSREEPTATPEPEPTAMPAPEAEPEEAATDAEAADTVSEEADTDEETEETATDEADEEAATDIESEETASDEVAEEVTTDLESEEPTTDEAATDEAVTDEADEEADEEAADDDSEEAATDEGSEAAETEALASADGADITILLNDLYFGEINNNLQEPPVWTVSVGQEYAIELANQSPAVQHSWVVIQKDAEISVPYNEELDKDSVLFDSGLVDAEANTTIAFTAPEEAGEYFVICTVPGHSVVMQGQLVVE